MADQGHLEQVLLNLVVNARDAISDCGSIAISVENVSLAGDVTNPAILSGDAVVLSVSDDGCGIDAATMEHIFEPFFTTKGPERGTGLGLATVYGIVKQCGGTIEVSSEPGQGTTFRLFFPRANGLRQAFASEPMPVMKPAPVRGGRIVLVETEPAIRALVREALGDEGFTIVEACHELEPDGTVRGPIDLLLAGIGEPGMPCYELTRGILSAQPDLPVVFLGSSGGELVMEPPGHRHATVLHKPFKLESLLNAVGEALRSRAATEGSPSMALPDATQFG